MCDYNRTPFYVRVCVCEWSIIIMVFDIDDVVFCLFFHCLLVEIDCHNMTIIKRGTIPYIEWRRRRRPMISANDKSHHHAVMIFILHTLSLVHLMNLAILSLCVCRWWNYFSLSPFFPYFFLCLVLVHDQPKIWLGLHPIPWAMPFLFFLSSIARRIFFHWCLFA